MIGTRSVTRTWVKEVVPEQTENWGHWSCVGAADSELLAWSHWTCRVAPPSSLQQLHVLSCVVNGSDSQLLSSRNICRTKLLFPPNNFPITSMKSNPTSTELVKNFYFKKEIIESSNISNKQSSFFFNNLFYFTSNGF